MLSGIHCKHKDTTEGGWPEEAKTISSVDLMDAYIVNEVSADDSLKGKVFFVTGTVNRIGKDILDNVYITLRSGTVMRSIQLFFRIPGQISIVSKLRKGDHVTALGLCDGLMGNVIMKDCKIKSVIPVDDRQINQ